MRRGPCHDRASIDTEESLAEEGACDPPNAIQLRGEVVQVLLLGQYYVRKGFLIQRHGNGGGLISLDDSVRGPVHCCRVRRTCPADDDGSRRRNRGRNVLRLIRHRISVGGGTA